MTLRTFSDRIHGGIAILGGAQNDHGRLRRVLIEVAHRGQTLPVGEKQVRDDQIEGPLLQGAQGVKQSFNARPFDCPVKSIEQSTFDLFSRMFVRSDIENRVFRHQLYTSLPFNAYG